MLTAIWDTMGHLKYILFAFVLILPGEYLCAQSEKDSIKIIFSIQDSGLDPNADTIPFIKDKHSHVYFHNHKVCYNNKKIYAFKNTEYYPELLFLNKGNSKFIYIYPKYKDRSGPYIWYGLGVLFEITNTEIIIKSGCDYYDLPDIKRLFSHENHRIIRRIKLKDPLFSE